tara:strand:- start:86 stop:586 length:501 start_codon:yes stop_codon:yes gene_type:complete
MIIICNNCSKKFDVDSSLIPQNGRLLQCSACEHKWFFKNEAIASAKNDNSIEQIKKFTEAPDTIDIESPININEESTENQASFKDNDDIKNKKDLVIDPSKSKRRYNILSLIVVFMISFVSLIIILDTFQAPISKIFPNLEFILYNLYETINDIWLFLKDLIRFYD